MRDTVYDIDYPYAEKVLKALDEATPAEVARAFQTALKRNMGLDKTKVRKFKPEDKSVNQETRFELFFGELFTVAPKELTEMLTDDEVRTQIVMAKGHLENLAAKEADADMVEMYQEDAAHYGEVLKLFDSGDLKAAFDKYQDQDTAARDNLFINLNNIGEIRLNRYLHQY